MKRKSTIKRLCKCIKSVHRKFKESSAIAICVKSVLQTKNRTIKSFSCRKGKLQTQKMKRR